MENRQIEKTNTDKMWFLKKTNEIEKSACSQTVEGKKKEKVLVLRVKEVIHYSRSHIH